MLYLIRHNQSGRYISKTEFNYALLYNMQILSDEKHPPMLFTEDNIDAELADRDIDLNAFTVVRADAETYRNNKRAQALPLPVLSE